MAMPIEGEVKILSEYIPEMFKLSTEEELIKHLNAYVGPVGSIVGKTVGEAAVLRKGILQKLIHQDIHPWDVFDWSLPILAFFNGLLSKPKVPEKKPPSKTDVLKAKIEEYKLYNEFAQVIGKIPVYGIEDGEIKFLGYRDPQPKKEKEPYDVYLEKLRKEDELLRRSGYEPIYEIDKELGIVVRRGIRKIEKKEEKKDVQKGILPGIYLGSYILPYERDYVKELKKLKELYKDDPIGFEKAVKTLDVLRSYELSKNLSGISDVQKQYLKSIEKSTENVWKDYSDRYYESYKKKDYPKEWYE